MRTWFLTAVVSSVLCTGCSSILGSGLEQCEVDKDCGSDQMCTQRLCMARPGVSRPDGCGTRYGSTAPDAIQMGALVPLSTSTDPSAPIDVSDEQALNAARLALEEINQRGIGGRQISLHFCDTALDEERARKQADWLVNDRKVVAMLTAGSIQTFAVAETVNIPNGVLTMSYSATSPELTSLPDTHNGSKGLLWRTAASDYIQGTIIANLLRGDSRFGYPKRVGILYVNDPYGQGLYNVISSRLERAQVVSKGFPYSRQGDVRSVLESLNEHDPDVTVLMGFAEDVATILLEASTLPNLQRTAEANHRWFFSDSVKDAALLDDPEVAAQAQGFYGTGPAQGAGQAFRAFRDSFQVRFQTDPSKYGYTSNAYDAMYLMALGAAYSQGTTGTVTGTKMAEGLTMVSTGKSSIQTQLTSSNFTYLAAELAAGRPVNVEGASGHLDFDDAGDTPAPVELWQVSDKSFVTIPPVIDPPQSYIDGIQERVPQLRAPPPTVRAPAPPSLP